MTDFKKHLVLILLLLGGAGAFNGMAPAPEALRLGGSFILPGDAFSAGLEPSEPAAREVGQEDGKARTINVIGRGTIYHDDVAKARNSAIEDALQGVVETAVGLLISPASVVEDFQSLSDQIYNQTEAFIHEYKILTESKSEKYYRVVVRASVSMSAIQDKLHRTGILITHKGMPAIIIFLSEQNIDDFSPKYWWGQASFSRDLSVVENAIAEYMREKGFVIVNRSAVACDIQLGLEHMNSDLSDSAAVKLGKEFGADVVIVGEGVARYGDNVSNINTKSIQARVSARAIRTDTRMLVASSQANKGVMRGSGRAGGTEALILSASAVAQDLAKQIVAKFREDPKQAVLVELVVKGIREYADFVRFRKRLKNDIRGVRNVYLRSISADVAKMDVDVMGNAKTLADDLVLQPFEDLLINIIEASEEGVKLELISRSKTVNGEP